MCIAHMSHIHYKYTTQRLTDNENQLPAFFLFQLELRDLSAPFLGVVGKVAGCPLGGDCLPLVCEREFGEWQPLMLPFSLGGVDVIVSCKKQSYNNIVYQYQHRQVY